MTNKRQGFTLSELLITIAIIAILSTVTIIGFVTHITTTRKAKAEAEATQVNQYLDGVRILHNAIYLGKDNRGNNVYIECVNGIYFITIEDYSDFSEKLEGDPFEISTACDDLKNIDGSITIYPINHFYIDTEIDGKRYKRILADVGYVSAHGIKYSFSLNETDLAVIKANFEIQMIKDILTERINKSLGQLAIGKTGKIKFTDANHTKYYSNVTIRFSKKLAFSGFIAYSDDGVVCKDTVTIKEYSEGMKEYLDRFKGDMIFFYDSTQDRYNKIGYETEEGVYRSFAIEELDIKES